MRSNGTMQCRFGMTILILLFSTASGAWAQSPTPTPLPAPNPQPSASPTLEKEFFKNILRDQKAIWTSPVRVRGNDGKWLIPLGWGTAALIASDRDTGDEMLETDKFVHGSRIISYAGSIYAVAAEAGTFYLFGRATHNYRARETGLLSAEAAIDSGIVSTALKEITQRARPTTGKDRSKFFVGGNSFPSGHSIEAWSVATVVANEYHDHLAIQIAAYSIASAVSVARFTGHYHYLSDVLVGSAMGYGVGRYVYHTHHRKTADSGGTEEEEEETQSKSRWPAIVPHYNRHVHDYGVTLAWSF